MAFLFLLFPNQASFFKEHVICRRFIPATKAVYINHFIQARQYDNQEVKIIIRIIKKQKVESRNLTKNLQILNVNYDKI